MKYIIHCIVFLLLPFSQIAAQNKVAITFDDLPYHSNYAISSEIKYQRTVKLLEAAKRYKVPLIGFVNETKLYSEAKPDQKAIDILTLWLKEGHELGNHTFSHKDYNAQDSMAFFSDVLKGEVITKDLCASFASPYKYFRHPYLHRGTTKSRAILLEEFLKKHNYTEAPVTLDNSEWIFALAYDSLLRTGSKEGMKKLGRDYIQYMEDKLKFFERNSHDLFGRNISHTLLLHANNINADFFGDLLAMLVRNKYEFISLGEALKDPAYLSKDEFFGRAGISWLHRWALTSKMSSAFFKDEPAVPRTVLDLAKLASE